MDHNQFIPAAEASVLLGITTRALRDLRNLDLGPLAHRSGRAWSYRVGDLVGWVLKHDWARALAELKLQMEVEKVQRRRQERAA